MLLCKIQVEIKLAYNHTLPILVPIHLIYDGITLHYIQDVDSFYIMLTQTLNLTFLYVTVSTLNPTVGMVVTDCPNFSLYRIAVR